VKVHVKKCHPEPFAALFDGSKPFEFRKEDDCKFEEGDLLLLLEFDPGGKVVGSRVKLEQRSHWFESDELEDVISEPAYTGNVLKRRVTYVLRGAYGVPDGYAVLGLAADKAP